MKIRLVILACFASLTASPAHAANVTGKITFEGQAPAPQVLKADADPTCKMLHPQGITDDSVIINADGTLKNVFVYVKEGVSGKFDAPKDSVKFDQLGCQYSPKVFGSPALRLIFISCLRAE